MDSNSAPARRSFIAKYITQDDQSIENSSNSSSKSDHLRHHTPSTSLSSVVSRVQNKSWNNRDEKDNYSPYNSAGDDRREHYRHYSHHHSKTPYSHPSSSSSSNHHRQSSPTLNEPKHSSRKSRDRSRSKSRSRSRDRDRYRSGSGSDDYFKSHRSDSRDRSEGNSRSSHKSDRSYYNESRNKSRYEQDDDSSYHQSGSSYHHHSSRGSKSYSSATNDDNYYNNNEMEEGEIDQDDDTSNSANESSYSYHGSRDHSSRDVQKFDWTCYKCGVNNFKRRNQCFKCGTDREESEANDTGDEISPTPTNCLILRNLSLSITGDQVLSFIGSLTNVPIKSIRLPRDQVYHSPRGVCYLELHTTHEATQLMSLISSIDTACLTDRLPSSPLLVSYVKRTSASAVSPATATHAASLALAAAQWTNQKQQLTAEPPQLGTVNINGCMYQKYPSPDPSKFVLEEKSGFYYDHTTRLYYDSKSKYYYNSLTQQYLLWSPQYETYLPVDSKTGSTTIGATISASAKTTISSQNATSDSEVTTPNELSTSTSTTTTTATSQQANPCSSTSTHPDSDSTAGKGGPGDKKAEKVKTAKSIAKQMEKWAKTLNQRSSAASASIKPMVPSFMKDLKAAQAAAEEEQNDDLQNDSPETRVTSFKMSLGSACSLPASSTTASASATLSSQSLGNSSNSDRVISSSIANILDDGDDSDANEAATDPVLISKEEESKFLDFTKLLCRLCKRQFNSREQLTKHQTVSELHANNLKTHLKGVLTDYQFKELEKKQKFDKLIASTSSHAAGPSSKNSSSEYVDRAKERRRKWGIDVDSEPNRMKEKYFDEIAAESAKAAAIASTRETKPIDSSNVGSRMLKAMGWKEGQGLGKKGTGRTDIIHVEVRNETSGLGMKKPKTTQVIPGESYKDAVKRAMAQRYKELTEQEDQG